VTSDVREENAHHLPGFILCCLESIDPGQKLSISLIILERVCTLLDVFCMCAYLCSLIDVSMALCFCGIHQ
jgi:hypothetical protein